jgi:hypothetical protein
MCKGEMQATHARRIPRQGKAGWQHVLASLDVNKAGARNIVRQETHVVFLEKFAELRVAFSHELQVKHGAWIREFKRPATQARRTRSILRATSHSVERESGVEEFNQWCVCVGGWVGGWVWLVQE